MYILTRDENLTVEFCFEYLLQYTDPAGFEPAIYGLEGRRPIHARPRAQGLLMASMVSVVLVVLKEI